MDKDVKIGNAGDVDFAFSGGKASVLVGLQAAPDAAFAGTKLTVAVECPVTVPLEALKKAVDGKLPAEAPAIDMVFGWLEAALGAVK